MGKAAAGSTPRALRFYEANGLLSPPQRTREVSGATAPGRQPGCAIRELLSLSLGLTVADIATARTAWT